MEIPKTDREIYALYLEDTTVVPGEHRQNVHLQESRMEQNGKARFENLH
jgi:hypothetical protein